MPQEVIDLSVEDSPALPPLRNQAGRLPRRRDDEAPNTIILLSSDADQDVVNAPAVPLPPIFSPNKRRRLTPSDEATTSDSFEFPDIDAIPSPTSHTQRQRSPSPNKSHALNSGKIRADVGVQESDPIVFTSSPALGDLTSRPAVRQRGAVRSRVEDDGVSSRDAEPSRPAVPKLAAELSNRTAALLANLSTNRRQEKHKSGSSLALTSKSRMYKGGNEEGGNEDADGRTKTASPPRASQRAKKAKVSESAGDAHERAVAAQVKSLKREEARQTKLREKEADREQKQRLKEQRDREKAHALELASVNKLKKDKKASTPEMIVDLPSSFDEQGAGELLRTALGKFDIEMASYDSPVPNVVKWRRKVVAIFNEELGHWEPVPQTIKDERHAMCLLTATQFVEMVCVDSDLPTDGSGSVRDLDTHATWLQTAFKRCTIIYLIEGLETWMRKNKNIRNRAYQAAARVDDAPNGVTSNVDTDAPTRRNARRRRPVAEYIDEDMVEDALLRLQVAHGCTIHHTTSPAETAQWVCVFTQQISTIPYRAERMRLETSFCMQGGQVKTGEDAEDTFVKMLQEIVRVTASVAHGIVAEYPTVQALHKGLRDRGPTALQDLKKLANKDGTVTNSNIGPSISKRVHKIFLSTDPDAYDV
ncbi:MAG: hypothetical protein M1825_002458 [Sarcosagium campestre]|nr:MAG: hypothetical protein M1825_002458 [Sarcosagium campestre]